MSIELFFGHQHGLSATSFFQSEIYQESRISNHKPLPAPPEWSSTVQAHSDSHPERCTARNSTPKFGAIRCNTPYLHRDVDLHERLETALFAGKKKLCAIIHRLQDALPKGFGCEKGHGTELCIPEALHQQLRRKITVKNTNLRQWLQHIRQVLTLHDEFSYLSMKHSSTDFWKLHKQLSNYSASGCLVNPPCLQGHAQTLLVGLVLSKRIQGTKVPRFQKNSYSLAYEARLCHWLTNWRTQLREWCLDYQVIIISTDIKSTSLQYFAVLHSHRGKRGLSAFKRLQEASLFVWKSVFKKRSRSTVLKGLEAAWRTMKQSRLMKHANFRGAEVSHWDCRGKPWSSRHRRNMRFTTSSSLGSICTGSWSRQAFQNCKRWTSLWFVSKHEIYQNLVNYIVILWLYLSKLVILWLYLLNLLSHSKFIQSNHFKRLGSQPFSSSPAQNSPLSAWPLFWGCSDAVSFGRSFWSYFCVAKQRIHQWQLRQSSPPVALHAQHVQKGLEASTCKPRTRPRTRYVATDRRAVLERLWQDLFLYDFQPVKSCSQGQPKGIVVPGKATRLKARNNCAALHSSAQLTLPSGRRPLMPRALPSRGQKSPDPAEIILDHFHSCNSPAPHRGFRFRSGNLRFHARTGQPPEVCSFRWGQNLTDVQAINSITIV